MAHIFISHASSDDAFVHELRAVLEAHQLPVWVDSRDLRGGARLAPEIDAAIEQARQVIVVLSPDTVNSPWVRKEVSKALEVEREKQDSGYRVIPLLLPGIKPSALTNWFDEEPIGIHVERSTESISKALPAILAALGEQLSDDHQPAPEPPARPVAELQLKLKQGRLEEISQGKWRVRATAQLIYDPADAARTRAESSEFRFTAPLGPIESDDLRWYLEEYYRWPTAFFTERAKRIEEQLPQWGQQLYDAATTAQSAHDLMADWQQSADGIERRFSIFVDSRAIEGSDEAEQAAANEAASALLALPWELMHDGRSFLFHGKYAVRVRRCLPKQRPERAVASSWPIRILLVSPRPEDERAGYIDHRISARPLVAAIESLGDLAELSVLDPPTLPALRQALQRASDEHRPFDVIHFDGHGVYDRQRGLGALCFEDSKDSDKLERRASQLVDAEELAALVKAHRIPLVFLEACQSAAEAKPSASVAAKLLDEGVTSVVAMTHSVLVETARRFVTAFYGKLAEGHRIGTAMLAGQQALYDEDFRFHVMGAGALRLKDWFVPVLYQEENDPRLVTQLLAGELKRLHQQRRRLSLGALPEPPAHSFVGRSRDLLKLERMLANSEQRYMVVRGRGGEGKTTLAVELARWLVETRRFERAAFVSLEEYSDALGALDSLGQQLIGKHWSAAEQGTEAIQHVERTLRDRRTIIVLDNMESLLRDDAPLKEIFALCQALLNAGPATRLVFTSREPLPEPFAHSHRTAELRELDPNDAIELVSQVMKREGLEPKHDDAGNTPTEVAELVEAVGCHARALTLLAREIAIKGVSATTGNVQRLMEELERKHPGERENSLYASVELSLRRLPPEMRQQIKALGVFHSGANLMVMPYVLGVNNETALDIGRALIEVGLAEEMPYGHLRLDPALPLYLLRDLGEAGQEAARSRWAEAMMELRQFLSQQQFQDAELSARLTLLELSNLMALLDWAEERATPEEVVNLAGHLEELLTRLGRPQALARATRAREKAALRLGQEGSWSRAHFNAESSKIDRLLESGQLPAAYLAAQQLLERSLAAGEAAYPGAGYNIAMAQIRLGRVLKRSGAAEAALALLGEAQRRFQALADTGNTDTVGMASAAIAETADCLRNLGRLDEAAAAYQEAIAQFEKFDDRRGIAVGKGQLGTVRLLQGRYQEALAAYAEARSRFESLGEPGSVAVIWHQIGMVHREAEQFEQAESAYRQSLAIRVREKLVADEAASLGELGNLYSMMERLEEAVKCYRQAAVIYARLPDQRYEGIARSNLADILVKLARYDEARRELLRAIECKKPYGHAAESWKTWAILHNLEQTIGDHRAAAEARQRAIEAYLAYRHDGGQSYEWGAQACATVAAAIELGATTELAQELTKSLETEAVPRDQVMLLKLQAILGGSRDPALADDPVLYYRDAVELSLLLGSLGAS
ncbi:MAG TPA: tetratricopeptide repeat protein [Blastocatellia bacterium]|nr:tetratricopeptide repeat protein [Blastocatellia bacterium]